MKRVTPDRDVGAMRNGFEWRMGLLPSAAGVTIQSVRHAGIDCELHTPEGCEKAPLIYYLHGGAYVMGSPATHRRLLSHFARMAGMRALLPDYRLAPEHRYPAALQDSLAVYNALLQTGERSSRIIIGGDSAGGNLAVATLLALRDAGTALPAVSFLLSPWLDLSGEGESLETRAQADPWFRPEYMSAVADHYCAKEERRTPLVSPVYADASGLPPTIIHVGDDEILLSDSERLAQNISDSGGWVQLKVWPQMWHVFQLFIGQMPESRQSVNEIVQSLRAEFQES